MERYIRRVKNRKTHSLARRSFEEEIYRGRAFSLTGLNILYCVLVAGIKPWEVSATVAALASLRGVRRLLTVVSYGDEEGRDQMRALMQKAGLSDTSIAAPWQPNPFKPSSLGCYEAIRPILETMLKEEELCV